MSSLKPLTRKSWSTIEYQRKFLDDLGKQLGFKQMDDWYKITFQQIERHGGSALLHKYYRSPSKVIRCIYSEYSWDQNRFRKVPKDKLAVGYWDHLENRINLMKTLKEKFQVEEMEDWYRISMAQIREKYSSIFDRYSMETLLTDAFPSYNWDINKLRAHYPERASQRWLKVTAQNLFPNSELFENFRYQKVCSNDEPKMEFDLFLPKEKLAFEYQGEHHYYDVYHVGNHWERTQRDKAKKELCEREGITLINIPYWWDKASESLAATIFELRPDLISGSDAAPITTEIPIGDDKGMTVLLRFNNMKVV
jgi:hypothetical protein